MTAVTAQCRIPHPTVHPIRRRRIRLACLLARSSASGGLADQPKRRQSDLKLDRLSRREMLQEDVAQSVVGAAEHAVVPRACVHTVTNDACNHAAHAAQRVATVNSRAGCAHPADGPHGTGPSEAMRMAVHMSHRPTNAIACHGEDTQLHDARARRRRTGARAHTHTGTHADAFMHACHGGNGTARPPVWDLSVCISPSADGGGGALR